MRITHVEAFALRWTAQERYLGGAADPDATYYFRPGYRCVYSHQFESTLVKISTDDGVEGWGECLSPVVPQVAAILIRELLRPLLQGADPGDVEGLYARMYDAMRDRGHDTGFMLDAIAAVDIALWDVRGKALGQSLTEMLGGARTESVPVYVSGVAGDDLEQKAAKAKDWWDRGFRDFKLHQGFGVQADLASFDAVRQGAGPHARIALDGHWAYAFDEALKLGKALEQREAWFFEAPMDPENVAAHAELARRLDIPVALGEGDRTRYRFDRILEERAAGLLQPDLGRIGVTETLKIAALAAARHVPIALHASTGMGILTAANAHVATLGNVRCLEYQPLVFPLANTFLREPLRVEAGRMVVPQGPGLGVEVDEELVRARSMSQEAEAGFGGSSRK